MVAARQRMPVGDANAVAGGGNCLRNVRSRAMMRHCTAPQCGAISSLKSQVSRLEAQGSRLEDCQPQVSIVKSQSDSFRLQIRLQVFGFTDFVWRKKRWARHPEAA